jgi:hypothetical protein
MHFHKTTSAGENDSVEAAARPPADRKVQLVTEASVTMIRLAASHATYIAACRWPMSWQLIEELQQMWSRSGQCWFAAGDGEAFAGLRSLSRRGDVCQMVVVSDELDSGASLSRLVQHTTAVATEWWGFRKCEWWFPAVRVDYLRIAAELTLKHEYTLDGALATAGKRTDIAVWSSWPTTEGQDVTR